MREAKRKTFRPQSCGSHFRGVRMVVVLNEGHSYPPRGHLARLGYVSGCHTWEGAIGT